MIFNFSAGPAMLPKEVLEQAQAELLDWQGRGTSVMEVSHRGKPFIEVAEQAEQDLRDILSVPNNYKVLFMHGGGRGQFSAVPLNLSGANDTSQHIVTGSWSRGGVVEAKKYNKAEIIAESFCENGLMTVPSADKIQISDQATYLQYCPNETVDGIEINWVPNAKNVPIVADMSSNILSKPLNVSDYGVIYAGAQKNIGPSGLTLVIVRDDLLGKANPLTPEIFNYETQVKADSMHNTPPTFSWYLAGLVFGWIKKQGGLAVINDRNQQKSDLIYQFIDNSSFYANKVDVAYRSRMNVTFVLKDESLNTKFLEEAELSGLQALKGHRSVGGMRASIYNAMPIEGVAALVEFMLQFEKRYG